MGLCHHQLFSRGFSSNEVIDVIEKISPPHWCLKQDWIRSGFS